MGLKNGHSHTYCIHKLNLNQIYIVAKDILNNYNNNSNNDRRPSIDIDVSLIIHKRGINNIVSNVNYLLKYSEVFANIGLDVMLVFDGDKRHHSKRATVQRIANANKKKIELIINKSELMVLNNNINETDSIELRNTLLEQQQKLKKSNITLENSIKQSKIEIGKQLYNATKRALINRRTDITIGNIKCCQALFQADSVMAGRILARDTELLLTSDSDQAGLLGSACICIKEAKFRNGSGKIKSTIEELVLFFATRNTFDNIILLLNLPKDNNNNVTLPKIPLFEDIHCERLRALIAVGIGCDINLYPIVSSKLLLEFINSSCIKERAKDDAYYELKKYLISQYNINKNKTNNNIRTINDNLSKSDHPVDTNDFSKMVDIFVDTILYEPTITDQTNKNINTYMFGLPPNKLHDYIKIFNNSINETNNNPTSSTSISNVEDDATDVVDCCLCVGTCGQRHLFLEAEGFCCCDECGRVCCLQCICSTTKVCESKFCYDCYLAAVSVTTEQGQQEEHTLTNNEIRHQLNSVGIETTPIDGREELLDLYEAQNKDIYDETTLFNKIQVPKETANYLHTLQSNKVLLSTKFNVGGKFVVDKVFHAEQILKIMEIMTSLVIMYKNKSTDNATTIKTYRNVPASIVEYAEKARINTGYRLVKRAIRHATDPQTNSLLNSGNELHVVDDECNQVALVVHHWVAASMRKTSYRVVVCFNSNTLISCTCTCRAGCTGEGRVMCVHVLPILYLVTLQLYDGLADNILVELANNWKRISVGMGEDVTKQFKNQVILLKNATHQLAQPQDEHTTIEEILEKYLVGTERAKFGTKVSKRQQIQLLCPLRDLPLHSSNKVANNLLQQNQEIMLETSIEDQLINNITKTTYQSIVKYITSFKKCVCRSDDEIINDFVGYQVINMRSYPITFSSPGDLRNVQKNVIRLVELANGNRITKRIGKRKHVLTDEEEDLILEEQNNNEQHKVVRRYKKRYTCCACNITSTNDTTTTFKRLPFTHQKLLTNNDNDRVRQTYYKRLNNRRYILKRLSLNQCDPRTDLRCCGNHDWEITTMQYSWQDTKGKWIPATSKFCLPVDPNDPPSRTRIQQQTRQPLVVVPPIIDTIQHQQRKKRTTYRRCSYWNCNNKGINYKYQSIPPIPIISAKSKSDNRELLRYAVKYHYRINLTYCCGIEFNDRRKDIRICEEHDIEEIEKEIQWIDTKQQTQTVKTIMYLPKINTNNTTTQQRRSSGLGRDRWINRHVDYLLQNLSQEVAQTVGLVSSVPVKKFKVIIDAKDDTENNKPVVRFSDLTKSIVKDRTGFQSILLMIAFIVVVSDGNFDKIQQTTTKLTWLEEWFLYFETVWCKSTTRWVDVERQYKISSRTVRRIFDAKLLMHINAIKSWPKFVDYNEDERLRKATWSEYYGNRRIIMWDNTSLPMFKPSSSSVQRDTYSAYYAGNVVKGGVFIQPCGWIGTHELWVGSVSDTEYMEKSNAYKQQQTYLQEYDIHHADKQWTIIFDKGYRVSTSSWSDDHLCEVLQPTFARSDDQFTDYETLRSAAVASDRPANERAVCMTKRSGYLSRGLLPNECPKRFSNVWIAFGFQANFMYKPVL